MISHGVSVRRRAVKTEDLANMDDVTYTVGTAISESDTSVIEVNSGFFLSR